MTCADRKDEGDVVPVSCGFADLFGALVLLLGVYHDDQRLLFVDGCLEGPIGNDLLIAPWLSPQPFLWRLVSLVVLTAGASTLLAAALAELPADLIELVDDLLGGELVVVDEVDQVLELASDR